MKILFANIGNRNLIINGNYEWVDEKGFIKKELFKEKTKEILDNFDKWKDKLKVNILDVLPLEVFDKIYLVGTNQKKNESQDTIFVAKILEKLLGDKVETVEFSSNPTDRKAVLYYFKKIFKERVNPKDKLYLLISGGIPAMKEAMVWAGLSEEFDVSVLEVINNKLEESKIEEIYLKEIYKKSLKLFIENYDWFGAEKLIEENKRYFGNKEDFLYKLKYVNARFNFDFDSANKFLTKIKLKLTEETYFSEIYINNDLEGIKELLHNIEITYRKGEYTMLLGKLFRLQESLYRYVFEQITGVSTQKDENKKFKQFEDYVNNNLGLKQYLVENNIRYTEPNTFVLLKILSYFKDKNKIENTYLALFGLASSIDKLKETRNNSIMAHGWKGVSKMDLDNENILNKIQSLKDKLKLNENVFVRLNNFILEEINSI